MATKITLKSAVQSIAVPDSIRVVLESMIEKALDAADPYHAVEQSLQISRNEIVVSHQRRFFLREDEKICLAAIGKAAIPMSQAVFAAAGERITAGAVITKTPGEVFLHGRNICTIGNHPIPGNESVKSAENVLRLFPEHSDEICAIFLISGGGSALITQPIFPVTLADVQNLTRNLLECGAPIQEINCLRKHLDGVKGGRLYQKAQPADGITLILSDVIGDPVDMIASGPTVPDPTTYQQAWDILEKYQLTKKTSKSILDLLQDGIAGRIPETLKKIDEEKERSVVRIVGSNRISLDAALEQGIRENLILHRYSTPLIGEARDAGIILANQAAEAAKERDQIHRPVCWIFGGETTVTVRGNGRGGRNLETALSAAIHMSGLHQVLGLTFATDGEDHTTGVAGAIIDGNTFQKAIQSDYNAIEYLERNDSLGFFEKIGGLIITGPTGTNVNDLTWVIAY